MTPPYKGCMIWAASGVGSFGSAQDDGGWECGFFDSLRSLSMTAGSVIRMTAEVACRMTGGDDEKSPPPKRWAERVKKVLASPYGRGGPRQRVGEGFG